MTTSYHVDTKLNFAVHLTNASEHVHLLDSPHTAVLSLVSLYDTAALYKPIGSYLSSLSYSVISNDRNRRVHVVVYRDDESNVAITVLDPDATAVERIQLERDIATFFTATSHDLTRIHAGLTGTLQLLTDLPRPRSTQQVRTPPWEAYRPTQRALQ